MRVRAPLQQGLLIAFGLVVALASVADVRAEGPTTATHGMVATAHPLATASGTAMLAAGGNAVDAAVAIGFALGVVEPWSSGFGGGGFLIVHLEGETTSWDFRETAPAAAHRDLFLRDDGEVAKGASTWSARAAAIPGLVRGLVAVHRAHGRLPLAVVVAPALSLARDGFPVSEGLQRATGVGMALMNEAARAVFLSPDGDPWPVGHRLVQADLGRTIQAIVDTGGESFYTGATAKEMVRAVRAEGGIWTEADLAAYRPVRRPVVTGSYRGHRVASMGPPSSGGLLLVQMLSVLETFDRRAAAPGSVEAIHVLAEASKRAFAMRASGLGDPDQVPVAWESFVGPEVVARLAAEVRGAPKATPAAAIATPAAPKREGRDTSHFGVLMANGDAVACTQTVNLTFGNGRVAGASGVLLNNEMDDFSARPGTPNAFGLLGDEANGIAPGKRPLSSMTPTILIDADGRARGVFGSPGGSRIITTTLQTILNVVDHGMDARAAVAAPRVHHQWQPDELRHEPGALTSEAAAALVARGHPLREVASIGNASVLWRTSDGRLTGAPDPRGEGTAVGLGGP